MQKVLNEQQLSFCEHFAQTNKRVEAAIKAGYSKDSAHKQAHILLANPLVQLELNRHAQLFTEANMITKQGIANELDEAIEFAKSEGKPSAMVSAIKIKGDLAGLFTKQLDVNIKTSGIDELVKRRLEEEEG